MSPGIITHSRPTLNESDIEAVISALQSGQISQGPRVKELERAFAEYIGKKNGAATSSGSAALHLALLALDVKEKDEVIIPDYVCSAVLNAVRATSATPVLADIGPGDYNISVESVKRAVSNKTKAIIVPHMFGSAAEIDGLGELKIPLIEDCAQAVGAKLNGRKVGSYGLMSVYSFYATKMLTCGEGGMVLSDSEDLIAKIKDLRESDGRDLGRPCFNSKMTDIQASLALSQLCHLEKFIERRREIAERYLDQFRGLNLRLPPWRKGRGHVYYRFVVEGRGDSSQYLKKFGQKKVICRRPVYKPLHRYLSQSGFPHAVAAWRKAISIPLYPSLTEEEIKKIVETVNEVFET